MHRKTIAQVKRLREQVHNSMIRKDQDTNKKSDKKESSNLDKTDEENQVSNQLHFYRRNKVELECHLWFKRYIMKKCYQGLSNINRQSDLLFEEVI